MWTKGAIIRAIGNAILGTTMGAWRPYWKIMTVGNAILETKMDAQELYRKIIN